jgi:transposase
MPAPLRIVLTEAEEEMLRELRVAMTVPRRTRDRAHMLRLNAQGWNVPAIAKMFECHEHTVRATIRRWESGGLSGLWEAPGRGAKRRWTEADMEYIEYHLREKNQTYNSVQLSRILREERSVHISSDRLRDILKKKLPMETNPSKPSPKAISHQTGSKKSRPRDAEISGCQRRDSIKILR